MRTRGWIAAGLLGLVAGAALLVDAPTSDAAPWAGRSEVKLFSGGRIVGTWEATGPGRVDGNSFVFPVELGTESGEVRISGTFSVVPAR
jgi:hypothetical protein